MSCDFNIPCEISLKVFFNLQGFDFDVGLVLCEGFRLTSKVSPHCFGGSLVASTLSIF